MEPTIVLGALVVGLSLGLLGAGGSVLTVPLLVGLAGLGESEAVVGSLVVVGSIALVAAVQQARAGAVDGRAVLGLALPGMVGSALGAWAGGLAPEGVQSLAFGLLAAGAAGAMVRSARAAGAASARAADGRPVGGDAPRPGLLRWAIIGLALGAVTGFVGVGGGFLVVPALVSLVHLSLRRAVGTSLAVIAVNSAVGFASYRFAEAGSADDLPVLVLVTFVAFGVAGSLLGPTLSRRLPERGLRLGFAVLLLGVGGWMALRGVQGLA